MEIEWKLLYYIGTIGPQQPGKSVCFFVVWSCLLFGLFGCYFFAVWAGGVFFSLLFGRGTEVHPLTGLPGSSLSDPTTKKDQTAKKYSGSPSNPLKIRVPFFLMFSFNRETPK